jgi:L-threonylcarbamoyladenylate synthase
MKILGKDEILFNQDRLKKEIREGAVFIYPTDTIYGIGCIATDEKAVERIRNMKERPSQPFSVIAPSKEWIIENCEIEGDNLKWLDKLPGPYTYILKLKKNAVSPSVNPGLDSLGVRIPKHWFTDIVSEIGIPVVTTSVNRSGQQYMTSTEDLDPKIKQSVDYIFYEGEKMGNPSTIVLFSKDKAEIKER